MRASQRNHSAKSTGEITLVECLGQQTQTRLDSSARHSGGQTQGDYLGIVPWERGLGVVGAHLGHGHSIGIPAHAQKYSKLGQE